MKLSTLVAASAAIAGAAVGFSTTTASAAQVYESYSYSFFSDSAQLYVTNNSKVSYSNVTIDGADYGSLAPGASTPSYFDGDPGEGGASSALISYTAAGKNISFTVPVYDFDYNTTQVVGVGGIPEPATWTLMLMAMAAVGGAMRTRRRMAPVTAA